VLCAVVLCADVLQVTRSEVLLWILLIESAELASRKSYASSRDALLRKQSNKAARQQSNKATKQQNKQTRVMYDRVVKVTLYAKQGTSGLVLENKTLQGNPVHQRSTCEVQMHYCMYK
jgi:hypothetical protein